MVAQEDSGQGPFAEFGKIRHHLGVKRFEVNNAPEGKLEAREVAVSQSTIIRRIAVSNSDVEGRAEVPAGRGPPRRAKARLLENGTGTLKYLFDVLKRLQDHKHGWVFSRPVDPVELELYDYFDVIEKPMDLGTIEQKCHAKEYHHFEEFQSDVHLTFDNAMEFFNERSTIYQMAHIVCNQPL